MKENTFTNELALYRSEPINFMDKYFSVQFSLNDMGASYIFKLRNISLNGVCILVKEDSAVLKHLKIGDMLDMKYNLRRSQGSTKPLKTLIRGISKNPKNLFMGHSLVELSIIEQHDKLLWFSEKQNK